MESEKPLSTETSIEELLEQFSNGSSSIRRCLIRVIEARVEEISALGSGALSRFDPNGDDWAAGWILQVLNRHQPGFLSNLLDKRESGWFYTFSSKNIDIKSTAYKGEEKRIISKIKYFIFFLYGNY